MTADGIAARIEPVVAFDIDYDGATGDFVGYGSLVKDDLVLLHPRAARLLRAAHEKRQTKLRLQFPGALRGNGVIDGTLLVGKGSNAAFYSIFLDSVPDAKPHDLDLNKKTQAQIVQLLTDFLAEQESNDPSEPPTTRPEQPSVGQPNRYPPWCIIFPHCPGC